MNRFRPFDASAGPTGTVRIEQTEILSRPADFVFLGSRALEDAPPVGNIMSAVIASTVADGWTVEIACDPRPSVQQAFLAAYHEALGPLHELADRIAAVDEDYMDLLMEWAGEIPSEADPKLQTIAAFCVSAEDDSMTHVPGSQVIVPRITIDELPSRQATFFDEPSPDSDNDESLAVIAAANYLPRYDVIVGEIARAYS